MYTDHPRIEQILTAHHDALRTDLDKYRNHVYRVLNLAVLSLPDVPGADNLEILAIAAAFHDIGIWTHHTFDYLDPSCALAENYLDAEGLADWKPVVTQLIAQHHKITAFSGPHEQLTEAFRKADWADLSFGLIRFGLDASSFNAIQQTFPTKGFHRFLIRKCLVRLWQHPADPLPMFKR